MITGALIQSANADSGRQLLSLDMSPEEFASETIGLALAGSPIESNAVLQALQSFCEAIGRRKSIQEEGDFLRWLRKDENAHYTERALFVWHGATLGEEPSLYDFFEASAYQPSRVGASEVLNQWQRGEVQSGFWADVEELRNAYLELFGDTSFIVRLPFSPKNFHFILQETFINQEIDRSLDIAAEYFWIAAAVDGMSLANKRQQVGISFTLRYGDPGTEERELAGRESTEIYPPVYGTWELALSELSELLLASDFREEKENPGVYYSMERVKYEKKAAAEEGRDPDPLFWTLEAIEVSADF